MKENLHHIDDDLLVKYIVGEASEQEAGEIEAWLLQNADNRRYYDHFRTIWEKSQLLAPRHDINVNDAWERFRQGNSKVYSLRQPYYRRAWVRIAAALVLAAGIGWMGYFFSVHAPGNIRVSVVSGEAPRTDTLPDGSTVVLNKHSILSHPRRFNGSRRVVALNGEGFFSVTPNKAQPFIVQVNDMEVKVVGTSFNIKMSAAGTEVIVETGVVQVIRDNRTVILHPGEKIIAASGSDGMKKENNTDQLYNYYRSREFVCDRTPLWKLVQVLNEAYDAHIVIGNPSLAAQPISTTFVNEPLDKILNIISVTFAISVEKKGDRIVLR